MASTSKPARTTYAVWELTLACNLGCVHCGSRAGSARNAELSTAEALHLVQELATAGIREVTLIGGEAYLRADWLEIVAAIRGAGMSCSLTTGGFGISGVTAKNMRKAGVQQVSVSIDGRERTHDTLRGRPGSWEACFRTLALLKEARIPITCNTQINRLSAPELPLIYHDLRRAKCRAWQVQLTVPMGRAADRPELLLQPPELLDLFPLLSELADQAHRDGILFHAGNNIGYYGPFERRLRNGGKVGRAIWQGCQAGTNTLGIEADGTIKGCPSLPTAAYRGGNIREDALADILAAPELNFNTGQGTAAAHEHLWGFCAGCDYGALCRGGCSWTAHVFFGRRGNNPYCYHRAAEQARAGIRERLVLQERAAGLPFDHGIFSIVEEPVDAPWPSSDAGRFTPDRIQRNGEEPSNVHFRVLA